MAGASPGSADLWLGGVCVALLVGILSVLALLVTRVSGGEGEKPEQQAVAGQRRRGALDRMQRGARATAGSGAGGEGPANSEGSEQADGVAARGERRAAQKEQQRQERREQQQAERQARQQHESGKQERQQKYHQRQQEKEAERQRKEDDERKRRDEKEKQEQAEFDSWRGMFAVDAEGEDDAAGSDESVVERFIEYVKIRKVVNLEDIAAEFRMKTSAAIDRLEQLEKLGHLSGIFDDRGKFVYISAEEMASVADWLKKRGRISRGDLVAACNRIIRLNPTEADKARLQQEAHSAAAALEEDAEAAVVEGAAAAEQ
mmetsp:Transcript_111054/g.358528  ORF Transcript_111054/g.358528 Transcript_111054/m.358528 type:complete len:317 (-) Transcript_111054:507-1457(-)